MKAARRLPALRPAARDLDEAKLLLPPKNRFASRLQDERSGGQPLEVSLVGKMVTAAAMIARRSVNTMVPAHRTGFRKQ